MHLDIGKIYADVGLSLPDLPKLTLGYEQEFKNGEKSLTEWGGVQQTLASPPGTLPTGSVVKRIYPSFESVDELTHIFKAGLEYTVAGVRLRDQFRYEWYKDDTTRNDMANLNLNTGVTKTQTYHERYDHGAGFNTFTADSQPYPKFYWSVGNLYSTLNGDYS
jgi:hypothetical protein